MSMPDVMDLNSVGSDSHLQFTNWTIVNNGAWDYAADTRGYTVAGVLEYDDRAWSARYALAAMPTVANGLDLDWAISRAHAQNWEFELRKGLFSAPLKRPGAVRVLSYVNNAHMGNYRQSVQQFISGQIAVPDITKTERFGAVKYGFGLNTEQEVTDSLRLFRAFRLERRPQRVFRVHRSCADVSGRRRLQGERLVAAQRQSRSCVCLERHQARPPELSALRRQRLPAGRRKSELRAREHSGVVLQRASVARILRNGRRLVHRQSRLQPRPRAAVRSFSSRACRFLRQPCELISLSAESQTESFSHFPVCGGFSGTSGRA